MPLTITRLHKNELKQVSEDGSAPTPDQVITSWDDSLTLRLEDTANGVLGLRGPQLGAIYASLAHWTVSNEMATIVMPTGTGKTETMLSLLVLTKCKKLLVIVPTDPLRQQLADKFIELGLLRKLNLLNDSAFNPIVGVLKKRLLTLGEAADFIDKANVVVTTASLLSKISDDVFAVFIQKFTHLFIDEAHHAEAATWFEIREKFKRAKILQFTATPYRNDGKRARRAEMIYTYPLRKAQEEGYFKQIDLVTVSEWDPKKADRTIADKAVQILRQDRKKFPHILLARVETKRRADDVFEIYKNYKEFKVAKIYSGIPSKAKIKNAITNKEYQIIVCVDMLGEGFDLPQLKIAAFHDVKKSLPTTVQFTGRFTRTKYDEELGSAKIIVNLAGLRVKDNELDQLYAQDPDWNELLPRISEGRTQKEKDFQETLAGFNQIEEFVVSLRTLKPAMSTVVFRLNGEGWNPNNFEEGLVNKARYQVIKRIVNNEKAILVAITAEKIRQKWTDALDIFDLKWTLYLVHWNEAQRLLFIHSSDNTSLHETIAEAIGGSDAQIIDGRNNGQVFRCLDGVKRFKLQNVGLIQLLGKLIRFQMSVGTDIEPALTRAQINRAKKSHVFGVGYEDGNPTTIGCSYKGRIWSQIRNDVDVFIKWCEKVGRKLLDENIDPEQVLRGAIVPKSISKRPAVFPVCIDWSSGMYQSLEDYYEFKVGETIHQSYESELVLIDPAVDGNIKFGLEANNEVAARFELQIFPASPDYNDFKIVQTYPADPVYVLFGRQAEEIGNFFYRSTPEIWFADGSLLEGSSLSQLKEDVEPYERGRITSWDWAGIDLKKESQDVDPKVVDSIQYRCIEILTKSPMNYDIIYDDDYSGEIADVITIKQAEDKIEVELYHLKYAKEGKVSKRVDNLYEVCGQAQKSIHWKFKEGKEFFEHLLRRHLKCLNDKKCERLQKGNEQQLTELMNLAKYKLPLEFKIYIVQPSIPKSTASQTQLTLLGVTENYLRDKGQVELGVIGSDG